jgi:RNA polymerase sigma factor (TIGR02999 family)
MTPNQPAEDVTRLLAAAGSGDGTAAEQVFSLVYDELHRLAAAYMRRERPDHTLQPTALVHEAFLRLLGPGQENREFADRKHFIATAAVAMRRVLVNHAKARDAEKRGGGRPTYALQDAEAAFAERAIDLLALDEALDRLAELDATQARLVELRFFGGMAFEECASVLGISERAVYYEWAHARAWLRSQLASG